MRDPALGILPPLHEFHVPVMGTGFTIDTPLRVAQFGIDSVLSLADDRLIERIRRHYSSKFRIPFEPIRRGEPEARARRITAYLDLVHRVVNAQMKALRALPFVPGNDKSRYFDLLPESSPLAEDYLEMLTLPMGPERAALAADLTAAMRPGSIDVNIMTKIDLVSKGAAEGSLSDAKAALLGFARAQGEGSVVFSAGINPSLFGLLEELEPFHRD
ncbi:MAG TPA: hypothetical protein VMV18_07850, partial [bacterium]|nr:hypothetical protein [bacterium]